MHTYCTYIVQYVAVYTQDDSANPIFFLPLPPKTVNRHLLSIASAVLFFLPFPSLPSLPFSFLLAPVHSGSHGSTNRSSLFNGARVFQIAPSCAVQEISFLIWSSPHGEPECNQFHCPSIKTPRTHVAALSSSPRCCPSVPDAQTPLPDAARSRGIPRQIPCMMQYLQSQIPRYPSHTVASSLSSSGESTS